MKSKSKGLEAFLNKVPGKKIFGIYRFLPLFFLIGASLEFAMIKWHVGQVNFYKVYKTKRAQELAREAIHSGNSPWSKSNQ